MNLMNFVRRVPERRLPTRVSTIVIIAILATGTPVFGQNVTVDWMARTELPGPASGLAVDLELDDSGYVYVTGTTEYYSWLYTVKYDSNGDTVWARALDYNTQFDFPTDMVLDASRNIYLCGRSTLPSGTERELLLIKYLPNGDTAWVSTYPGAEGKCLDVDADGSIYVGVDSLTNWVTLKYSPAGDLLWSRLAGNGIGWPTDLVVRDSFVYVVGSQMGMLGRGYDFLTIKYTLAGDTAWVRRLDPSDGDNCNALYVDDSGYVYVTGSFKNPDYDGRNDFLTLKYSPAGDSVWARNYDGPFGLGDDALDVAVDAAGNVYVTGRSDIDSSGGTLYYMTTLKMLPDGSTDWVRSYEGELASGAYPVRMKLDGAANVYIAGRSWALDRWWDFVTMKYSSGGDSLWAVTYDGPHGASATDDMVDLELDPAGNVFVTGSSRSVYVDFLTIKYTEQPPEHVGEPLVVVALSPVDLVVTDPIGDSIGILFNTILFGSHYDTLSDYNSDGEPDDIVTIPDPYAGDYHVRIVREDGVPDSAKFTLGIRIDGNNLMIPDDYDDQPVSALGVTVPDTYVWTASTTLPGDANADGVCTSADIIYLVNYVFKAGPPPVVSGHGDANCDEVVTSSDIIYMVNFIFKSGLAPCSQTAG